MRRHEVGWTFLLAAALAIPTFAASPAMAGKQKAAKSDEAQAQGATPANLSKEDQERLREHNKLRAEIKKVKYPAAKTDVVAHVKGIKADDKKWFEETLPDRTYSSADDVYSALGWETSPEGEGAPSATNAGHPGKGKSGATK